MVGIGTSDVNLDKYRHTFCSLLGKDEDSWGLSYTGNAGRGRGQGGWKGSSGQKCCPKGLRMKQSGWD